MNGSRRLLIFHSRMSTWGSRVWSFSCLWQIPFMPWVCALNGLYVHLISTRNPTECHWQGLQARSPKHLNTCSLWYNTSYLTSSIVLRLEAKQHVMAPDTMPHQLLLLGDYQDPQVWSIPSSQFWGNKWRHQMLWPRCATKGLYYAVKDKLGSGMNAYSVITSRAQWTSMTFQELWLFPYDVVVTTCSHRTPLQSCNFLRVQFFGSSNMQFSLIILQFCICRAGFSPQRQASHRILLGYAKPTLRACF